MTGEARLPRSLTMPPGLGAPSSVNADHVLRVPHFPRPGETLTGHSYQVVPGGKGANQAVAAARLGAAVSFIARIGDDAIGRQMKAGFANDGIDVSAVEQDEHLPTGIAIIYVSDEGENSIGISAEANGALTPAVVKCHEALIADAHTLLIRRPPGRYRPSCWRWWISSPPTRPKPSC